MEWGNPWAFLGLLALPLLWAYSRPHLRRLNRWKAAALFALRGVLLLLLLAALADPSVPTRERRTDWMFLVDRSDSMTPDMRAQADAAVADARKNRAGDDRIAVMSFARGSSLDLGFGGAERAVPASEVLGSAETDLEHAIQAALAEFDAGRVGRIVLISDGNQTVGHALQTVESLKSNGIVLNAMLPVPAGDPREVVLENMVAPARVNPGDRYRVDIVVASNAPGPAVMQLFRGEERVERRSVELNDGETTIPVELVAEEEGLHLLRAEVASPDDTHLENNRYERFVEVRGGPHVLLVTAEVEYSRPLSDALQLQGLQVTMLPLERTPDEEGLLRYDVLIFDNVSGVTLTDAKMDLIHRYVRDFGGGFIMIGGDSSFGGGGYHDTPLEALLPVEMDVEMPIEMASVALVLVIDRSDSMGTDIGIAEGSGSRLEIAKLASMSAIEMLKPSDQVGVVGFDTRPDWFVPMGRAGRSSDIATQLAAMQPGGGTDIYVGMRTAVKTLKEIEAQKKHVIVLSDGLTRSRPFEELVEEAVQADITISTVGLAQMVDHRLLQHLATWGSGRYYFTDDPLEIPRIFTSETVMVSRGLLEEKEFRPVMVTAHEILSGLEPGSLPPLRGYVLTAAKPEAEIVLASPDEDPVLAVRQYGLGRSVAFTADLSTAWGKHWVNWPEYPRVVTHLVRWAARGTVDEHIELQVEPNGERARVTADLFDPAGHYFNRAAVLGRITYPGGEARSIDLRQDSPGRYQGEFPLAGAGDYRLQVTGSRDGQTVGPRTVGLTVPYGREYRARRPDTRLLSRLAEATGGKLHTGRPDAAVAGLMAEERRERVPQPMWWVPVLAAIVLFVADVAWRQLGSLRRRRNERE